MIPRRIVEGFAVSPQNMLWAARDGSIGRVTAAVLPARAGFPAHDPVLDATDPAATGPWRRLWDARDLPRLENPEDGVLASANENTSAQNGTGKDQQTSGPRGRDTYIGRLVNAIRSQMRYPASSPGNPVVTMRIEQLPNGEVVNVTMTQSSGVPAFDAAVERAIRAASPLPRDEQGKVERSLELNYKMYDRP